MVVEKKLKNSMSWEILLPTMLLSLTGIVCVSLALLILFK